MSELNDLLDERSVPFKIIEKDGKYFYTDRFTGEILGALNKQEMDELLENVKLIDSEVQRNLTYDKQAPSGNFLDLDI